MHDLDKEFFDTSFGFHKLFASIPLFSRVISEWKTKPNEVRMSYLMHTVESTSIHSGSYPNVVKGVNSNDNEKV